MTKKTIAMMTAIALLSGCSKSEEKASPEPAKFPRNFATDWRSPEWSRCHRGR